MTRYVKSQQRELTQIQEMFVHQQIYIGILAVLVVVSFLIIWCSVSAAMSSVSSCRRLHRTRRMLSTRSWISSMLICRRQMIRFLPSCQSVLVSLSPSLDLVRIYSRSQIKPYITPRSMGVRDIPSTTAKSNRIVKNNNSGNWFDSRSIPVFPKSVCMGT